MPRVVIDDREVEVPAGSTLLAAARKLGIDIPTLCYREGCRPNTACMVCLVKVADPDRFVPACAAVAEEGMRVASETEEVRQVRRTTLELLLSDHAGECRAPCQYACRFETDVPRMLREIAAGQVAEAVVTLRQATPLAAVLTRVSREVCEGACRRQAVDEAAAIGLLKRYVADKDLASAAPYTPPRQPASGRRVAIVGAGLAGLSAAYFLLQHGHDCTLFEAEDAPGGLLREVAAEQLPREVLAAEIALVERLGACFELNVTVGREVALEALRREHDAVLIAVGGLDAEAADWLGLPVSGSRLEIERATHETPQAGVFAAGDAVRPRGQAAPAAADGKAVATCIDQHLRGAPVTGHHKLPVLRTGRPRADEAAEMLVDASSAPRVTPSAGGGFTDEEARAEAQRCLRCDCRSLESCQLRKYAEQYGADGARYRGERRAVKRIVDHPDIVYEPGKCILCRLCVQIAEQAGEPVGLTLSGRGFDVCVAVPFEKSLSEALRVAGKACVEACPTGALAWRAEDVPCQRCGAGLSPKQ